MSRPGLLRLALVWWCFSTPASAWVGISPSGDVTIRDHTEVSSPPCVSLPLSAGALRGSWRGASTALTWGGLARRDRLVTGTRRSRPRICG